MAELFSKYEDWQEVWERLAWVGALCTPLRPLTLEVKESHNLDEEDYLIAWTLRGSDEPLPDFLVWPFLTCWGLDWLREHSEISIVGPKRAIVGYDEYYQSEFGDDFWEITFQGEAVLSREIQRIVPHLIMRWRGGQPGREHQS